jgi:hypothetical protein
VVGLHEFLCPECQRELCADPHCAVHPIEAWASVHAELHPIAMTAVLLYDDVR